MGKNSDVIYRRMDYVIKILSDERAFLEFYSKSKTKRSWIFTSLWYAQVRHNKHVFTSALLTRSYRFRSSSSSVHIIEQADTRTTSASEVHCLSVSVSYEVVMETRVFVSAVQWIWQCGYKLPIPPTHQKPFRVCRGWFVQQGDREWAKQPRFLKVQAS